MGQEGQILKGSKIPFDKEKEERRNRIGKEKLLA